MTAKMRGLFHTFNSLPFIQVLENISGIKGLIPDPYFKGGGFHEICTGGYLSIHADFNHHVQMDLERRINLLIYLNQDWDDAYGGQLELWDNDMSACVQSVTPVFNRAVMFNTTSFSNHGNPNPVSHPEGRSRKSIALYYYTATWDETKRSHTTQFRARPKSADKTDWKVRAREVYADFTPPILRRSLENRGKKKA
ncbi:MAG: 2OG-Fe(II) oxygenase [Pseudomonadota bacterium]